VPPRRLHYCNYRISKHDVESGELKHIAVNACLMPALAADGCHVTTIEGIGSVKDDNLHPIQKAMVEMHGSQCGFCTPGNYIFKKSLSLYSAFSCFVYDVYMLFAICR
jgi:xanthine dehydrogenase iron-sulfur cluster and FAD-binding subunit A